MQPSRKLWQRPYADWPSFLIIFGPATDDAAKLFKKDVAPRLFPFFSFLFLGKFESQSPPRHKTLEGSFKQKWPQQLDVR